jgi:predicted HAD superfamily Cof-like phosphohydrolase
MEMTKEELLIELNGNITMIRTAMEYGNAVHKMVSDVTRESIKKYVEAGAALRAELRILDLVEFCNTGRYPRD